MTHNPLQKKKNKQKVKKQLFNAFLHLIDKSFTNLQNVCINNNKK